MRLRRALVLAAACGGAAAIAVTAGAQVLDRTPAAAPILHKDLRSPLQRRGATPGSPGGTEAPAAAPATSASSVIGDEPAAGRNPSAIGTGDKILPEPPATAPPSSQEPVLGTKDFGADRETTFAPDGNTGADDDLTYVEAFNPSVVPFKRMTSLDAVDESYVLRVGSPALTELPVGGKPTPSWDRFWGSVLIDLEPGRDVPLPSVAPGMRILSYEVEPSTQLAFSRDGADNYYVRSEETGARGQHRLVFLVEADPGYFAPVVPRRIPLAEVARSPGAPAIPPLPAAVQAMARNVHYRLRVRPSDDLDEALAVLVRHFRAFEPRPFEASDGGIYWDLTINQAGVCRHRSFAFVITAKALGIPARFVANEAHAFTEVWVPGSGWIRIDLGGASNSLTVRNADGKTLYRPRGEDPFPRPAAYTEGGYSTLDGTLTGLTPEQLAEAETPRAPDGDGDGGGGSGSGDGDGNGGGGSADGDADGNGMVDPNFDLPGRSPSPGPAPGLPPIPAEAMRGKRPTRIEVAQVSSVGFRGETIGVEGVVRGADDAPAAGLRVEIYLAPAGRGGEGARMVGTTVTGADGRYRAEVLVPYEVSLDAHEVYVGTPGDDAQQPAISR